MNPTRLLVVSLLSLFIACATGCIRYSPMTYTVIALSRDDAGAVTTEGAGGSGQLTRPAMSAGSSVSVSSGGALISVTVTDVARDAITFTVSHRDHPDQSITVSTGQSQDVFPGNGTAGVRVSVASP